MRHPRPQLPEGPYLVVGLARSGRAVAKALRERGGTVIGVDEGAPERLRGVDELKRAGVEVYAGEDGASLARARARGHVRACIKSPGVPREAPVIAEALKAGMPVLGELEAGWRMLGNEVIAVTGTNGKTTTVEWIGHIHRTAGLPVAVAGNVGTALSSLAGKIDPQATVVCEVSSFQLEDADGFAPEAAVLLNISPDHLDRHKTFDAYVAAKLKVFAHQTEDDIAVVPADLRVEVDPPLPGPGDARLGVARRVRFGGSPGAEAHEREWQIDGREGQIDGREGLIDEREWQIDGCEGQIDEREGQICWHQGDRPLAILLRIGDLGVRGRHNVQNGMAAAAVCLARGIDLDAVREGLRTFTGVEHRLEEVAQRDGVAYVNDSKATNVASTIVALEAFAPVATASRAAAEHAGQGTEQKPGQAGTVHLTEGPKPGQAGAVHLILGGQGKGQEFASLREPVKRACREVYVIGEDAAIIAATLTDAGVYVHECGDLESAVRTARTNAMPGEVVLLSPACASYDQFEDYEERGERFRELVGGQRP